MFVLSSPVFTPMRRRAMTLGEGSPPDVVRCTTRPIFALVPTFGPIGLIDTDDRIGFAGSSERSVYGEAFVARWPYAAGNPTRYSTDL